MRWISVAVVVALISCGGGGGGGGGDPAPECSVSGKNQFVYEVMKDSYLWYDSVPDVDYTVYSSPDQLLDVLRYPLDHWSYIESKAAFDQYYEEGRYLGMGFSLKFDASQNLWVAFVFEDSPAAVFGFERTDQIISINDRPVSEFHDMTAVWNELYRYTSADILKRADDHTVQTITIAYDNVNIDTVLHKEIFTVGTTNVGYLVFESFIEQSSSELDTVFAEFKAANIEELILDLRYNGGGRMSVAQHLAGLIGGSVTEHGVFQEYRHNENYSDYDDTLLFTNPPNSLGLDVVYVLSTGDTCSASESIINGLNPFIDVILIGDTTCGKPVGMYVKEICDMVLLPIQFRNLNAHGTTDYFDGFSPIHSVDDDLRNAFGDPDEDMLEMALYHIEHGGFPPVITHATPFRKSDVRRKNELHGLRREIGAF
ncbi:MAG: peptidase [Desulfobacteraceae bacterium]|nr:peptidase [Desulfobacteraceae bacterium]